LEKNNRDPAVGKLLESVSDAVLMAEFDRARETVVTLLESNFI
jgi:hypothetical protein